MDANKPKVLHGLMAEFDTPTAVVEASRRAYREGYREINAYSPFPIEELADAVGFHKTRLPVIVFIGGLLGGLTGFGMQYWMEAIDYPINVGGRPPLSWPSFIPITFELTVLFAAFSALIGMLALNGLPRPYHPVFNAPRFALASRDRFFLVIESADPKYDYEKTRQFLEGLNPQEVVDVED